MRKLIDVVSNVGCNCRCIIMLVLVVTGVSSAKAQSGVLDFQFGNSGIARYFNSDPQNVFTSMCIVTQPDGKILLGGMCLQNGKQGMSILRLNTDGTIDSTFGVNGLAYKSLRGSTDIIYKMVLLPGGNIMALGSSIDTISYDYDMAITKFLADGTWDNTFAILGGAGYLTTRVSGTSGNNFISNATLAPNGNVVFCGTAGSSNSSVAFVGQIDTIGAAIGSWNGGQFALFENLNSNGFSDVAVMSNGSIVAAGYTSVGFFDYDVLVARYTPDLKYDSTFSDDGVVVLQYDINNDRATGVVVDNNGNITVGGYVQEQSGKYSLFAAAINPNGGQNMNFGVNGWGHYEIRQTSFDNTVDDVLLQPDGKLLLVSEISDTANSNGNTYMKPAVVRLYSNGIVDSTFGINGWSEVVLSEDSVSIDYNSLSSINSDLFADGRIVFSCNYFHIPSGVFKTAAVRLLNSLQLGVADFNKAVNNLFVYPNPVTDLSVLEIDVATPGEVNLYVLNSSGQLLSTVQVFAQTAGVQKVPLQIMDGLPSGIYFLNVTTNLGNSTIKLINK